MISYIQNPDHIKLNLDKYCKLNLTNTNTNTNTNTILMEPRKQSPADDEEVNDSPIEQVRLAIPITDDPTLPTLTFRTWLLGPITCVVLAILGQYSSYRQFLVLIAPSYILLFLLMIGKLMEATLPTKPISLIPGTKWTFSMNPGPFNVKEHTLLFLLANCGYDRAYSLGVLSVTKGMFHKNFGFWASFSLVQSTQMIGYGFAGIFIKFLVDSPYMWFPSLLPVVAMYRMVHDVEVRPKGKMTRIQFYIIVAISSFAYSIIPGYFFPSLIALSFVCWIWKDSVTAQQIGSGLHGLGIGSFTFSWLSMSTFAGNPLVLPLFVIVNMFAGFILITYIVLPIGYWTNSHNAKRFPFMSNDVFDVNGQAYNVSQILSDDSSFIEQRYNNYPMYWSGLYIYSTGFMLASEAAAITYFLLNHAREVWRQFKAPRLNGGNDEFSDVHNRLMKKYEAVPQWWFYTIIVSSITLAILNCMFNGEQFQLSYWMVLLGYSLPFCLILPAGVIKATTGQSAFDIVTMSQLLIGWIYPGKPIANVVFQSYVISTCLTAMTFLAEFKLGHYMKIPPKSMFIAQVTGAFISSFVNLVIQWRIFSTVENICNIEKLPKGSPWTCPEEHLDYAKAMVWGGLGTKRVFASHGQFSNIYIFVIIGVVSTVVIWKVARIFPEKKWIGLIHIPIIYGSATMLPPAGAVNFWSTLIVALIFNLIICKKYKEWWARYNYLLPGALSLGITFSQLGISWSLGNVYGLQWWGLEFGDHCPLAKCPTAPGIKVDGCPVF